MNYVVQPPAAQGAAAWGRRSASASALPRIARFVHEGSLSAFDAVAFDAQYNRPPDGSADGSPDAHPGVPFDPAEARAPGPPANDPLVAEVRATREALCAEAGSDLAEFARRVRARQAAAGRGGVVRPPRSAGRAP